MGNRALVTIAISFAVATLALEDEAKACPSGQYQTCLLGKCWCNPEIGGTVGQTFEKGKKELEGSILGGPALEQWIIASHNTALSGAMPIPQDIRQALTGYASENSMNRVRYKVGDSGFLNLAHVLEQGGYAAAVTLIDVVVFRGPSEASDPSTWAHELTHVDQYRDWGVHSFAVQYAKDYQSVEAPAYAKGNGYWAWAQQNGIGSTETGGVAQPPIVAPLPIVAQPQLGAFCYTQFGRFGPGPVQAVGVPCFVATPRGPLYGRIGQ